MEGVEGRDAARRHRSIMWAKLKCFAEGASIASKLLWH